MIGNESLEHQHAVFMKRALDLSVHAVEHGFGRPFGSLVVRGDSILGEGWNREKELKDPSAHAEVVAIRDAFQKTHGNLKGATIFASAQPCPMCLSLIYLTGIEKVYYCIPGRDISALAPELAVEHIYNALSAPRGSRPVPEIRISAGEASAFIDRYKTLDW